LRIHNNGSDKRLLAVRVLLDDPVDVKRAEDGGCALIIHNNDTITAWCDERMIVPRHRIFVTV
jgi:hypothetical protein